MVYFEKEQNVQILGRGMPTVTLTADFLATLEITFFLLTADISPNNESGIITDSILTTYQIVPCEMLGNCSRKMAPVFTAHSTSLLKHQCSKAWLSMVIWLLVCNSRVLCSVVNLQIYSIIVSM